MPFYTDSGEAIIPKSKPKETTPAPEPVTEKTKYLKPKTTTKKTTSKSTPAPTPTTTKSPLSVKETEFTSTQKGPPKSAYDSNSAESMRNHETQPTAPASIPIPAPEPKPPYDTYDAKSMQVSTGKTQTKSPLSIRETEFKEPVVQQPTVEFSSIDTTTAHRRKLEQTGEFSVKDSLSDYKKGDVVYTLDGRPFVSPKILISLLIS